MDSSDEWQFPEDAHPSVKSKIERFCAQRRRIQKIERLTMQLRKEQDTLAAEIAPYRLPPADPPPSSAQRSLITITPSLIHRLPNELLLFIFQQFIAPRGSHPKIRRLLLVCKRWHAIIMSSPNLWTSIEVKMDWSAMGEDMASVAAYVSTCAERSAGLLLNMDLDLTDLLSRDMLFQNHIYDTMGAITDESSHGALLDALSSQTWEFQSTHFDNASQQILETILGVQASYITRCHTLIIRLPEDWEIACQLIVSLNCATPYLASLEISGFDNWWGDMDVPEWFPSLGSLTALHLQDEGLLKSLKVSEEKLQNLKISTDLNGDNLSMLSSFTNLHTLHINCRRLGRFPVLSICLPLLVTLTISGDPLELRHVGLDLPSLNELCFKIDGQTTTLHTPAIDPHRIVLEVIYAGPGVDIPGIIEALLSLSDRTESLVVKNIERSNVESALRSFKETHSANPRHPVTLIDSSGRGEVVDI